MTSPALTRQQALSHYRRQRRIVAAALLAVRRLFSNNAPLVTVASTVSTYQLAAATAAAQTMAVAAGARAPLTQAAVFAGVSSAGFPIAEPLVATIDRFAPAPLEPLPANWWDDAADFMSAVEQLVVSEIQDAGRSAAQVEIVSRPTWQNYVRVLTPPSCPRCAILAGRIYKDLQGFQRHPGCDCVHWPVQNWEEAHDAGLVSSPQEAFDKGVIRGLSKADEQAIRDGADIIKIVNATRGITTATVLGNRVHATTAGTTRRSAWRRANPTRLVRLRPESIYEFAKDHEDAIRLLALYGYLK